VSSCDHFDVKIQCSNEIFVHHINLRIEISQNQYIFFCVGLLCVFRVVVSVTISAWTRCSVRLYLQLFIGGRMPYVRNFCMLAHSGVQHILCCAFVLFFFVLCSVAYVASFSGLSMFHCHLRFIAEILAKLMLGIEVKS
jgi:hypothetical protein